MRNAAFTCKLLLAGLTIALAGLPLTSRSQTKGGADQPAITAVIDRFVDAWNRHDAKAFAAVFAAMVLPLLFVLRHPDER